MDEDLYIALFLCPAAGGGGRGLPALGSRRSLSDIACRKTGDKEAPPEEKTAGSRAAGQPGPSHFLRAERRGGPDCVRRAKMLAKRRKNDYDKGDEKGTGDKLYSACIFDLDGTLLNTLNSIAYFSNVALEDCGYPAIPAADYRSIVGDGANMQVRRMLNRVAGEGGYTEDDFNRLRTRYTELYAARPTYKTEQYPGMPETLARLKQMGVRTAVLSNKPHAWVTAITSGMFPEGTFDLCFGQRDGVPRKPAPDGALQIARTFGAEPRSFLYIGDTDTDMKTGAAAGMDTCGALWGFRTRAELEKNHAVYLLEKPEEIVRLAAGGREG